MFVLFVQTNNKSMLSLSLSFSVLIYLSHSSGRRKWVLRKETIIDSPFSPKVFFFFYNNFKKNKKKKSLSFHII